MRFSLGNTRVREGCGAYITLEDDAHPRIRRVIKAVIAPSCAPSALPALPLPAVARSRAGFFASSRDDEADDDDVMDVLDVKGTSSSSSGTYGTAGAG